MDAAVEPAATPLEVKPIPATTSGQAKNDATPTPTVVPAIIAAFLYPLPL